ncbi:MAG TPA: hypothetical protein VEZ90_04370, partial [Blastocatellia bacterium]|nr:hypothetical protein [Blastocatellia bacterium]
MFKTLREKLAALNNDRPAPLLQRSKTAAIHPIAAALIKAEEVVSPGQQPRWRCKNDLQKLLIEEFLSSCRAEIPGIEEIESIASWDASEIDDFLRRRGFSIELRPFDPQTFGVASVLDLLVEWVKEGHKTTVTTLDRRQYPAVA